MDTLEMPEGWVDPFFIQLPLDLQKYTYFYYVSSVLEGSECWVYLSKVKRYKDIFPTEYTSYKGMPAHRFTYRLFRGNIPIGYEIDHICEVRPCCNPFHLRAVTHKENMSWQKSGHRRTLPLPGLLSWT